MVEPPEMDQEMHRQMIADFDGERALRLVYEWQIEQLRKARQLADESGAELSERSEE